jgi:hypothetical protein
MRKTVCAAAVLAVVATTAALADPPAEPVKDRASFIPVRKNVPVRGTAVGVLVHEAQPVLSLEGRSGPADQVCFSAGGNSYRWIYVAPMGAPGEISGLKVPVGERENAEFATFASLNLARLSQLRGWGVTAPYTLVEVEVNGGQGSPRNDSFVATKIKVLEGTKEYPLAAADAVKQMKARYETFVQEQAKAIDAALAEAQKKAIKDGKATGPRERQEVVYVTWLPESERLSVRFRTKVSDGQYQFVGGGARPIDPPPLPVKPGLPINNIKPGLPEQAGPARFPPPPPREFEKVRVGTTFGVEFGMAYEVAKDGKLVRVQSLPFENFQQTLQPPPGVGGPGPRPRPLPLPVEK